MLEPKKSSLDQAIFLCGSHEKLAEILGVKLSTVGIWLGRNKGKIPARYVKNLREYALERNKHFETNEYL